MAERRRGKQKKQQDDQEKPTKEEYAVAKFMRFNVPAKEGKLMGMSVQYFIASKAVDMLLESKWGSKAKSDPLFTNRVSCVDYCDRLLQKGLFHRALKLERTKKDKDKKKKKKEDEEKKKEKEEEEVKKSKKKSKKNGDKSAGEEKDSEIDSTKDEKDKKVEEKKDDKKDEEKKKKKERKWKLEMHQSQNFKDGEEVYVWIYDPVPLKTFLIGLLLVLGAIAICLFPLWPPEVRLGIYYLSLLAAGFVGFILLLCIIRLILFCIVWGVTFGKHHFWFLPNLTEDVGFFDSFKPLYHHEAADRNKDKGKKKSDDNTNDSNKEEKSGDKVVQKDSKEGDANEEEQNGENGSAKEDSDNEGSDNKAETGSELENDNGFEVVDPEDLRATEPSEEEEEDTEPKKTK